MVWNARDSRVRAWLCRRAECVLGGQSSRAVMSAGRHVAERGLRMWVIAEGVKGELRISRESFVVWALRMMAAVERSASGF